MPDPAERNSQPSSVASTATSTSTGPGALFKWLRSTSAKGSPTSAPSSPRLDSSSAHSSLEPSSSSPSSGGTAGGGRSARARLTGSSSRSAGVKPKRTPSPAPEPPRARERTPSGSPHRREAVGYASFAGIQPGPAIFTAGPQRGGLITQTHSKTAATVATSTTNSLSVQQLRPVASTVSSHSSRSNPIPALQKAAGAATEDPDEILPPSQMLPKLLQSSSSGADVAATAAKIDGLAKSVATFPFPPPLLSAEILSEALSHHPTNLDPNSPLLEPVGQKPEGTPLNVYLTQREHLSPSAPAPLKAATLRLLLACLNASIAQTGGIKEVEKAFYWEEVRRWAVEAKVEQPDGQGGNRWALPDEDREALVKILAAITKGGRDLSDVPGLVALLCTFVTDALPVPRPASPLFDPTLSTAFTHTIDRPPAPHASSLALLVALHKFCAASIYKASTHLALRAVLDVARLSEERDLGDAKAEVGVLGFLSAVVRYGEVAGSKVAAHRGQSTQEVGRSLSSAREREARAKVDERENVEILREVVQVVARIVGCEGLVGVVELVPGRARPTNPTKSSDLPIGALNLMQDLISSPANQALKSLRGSLIAPPPEGETRPPTPKLLIVGVLRSLRKAFELHSEKVAAGAKSSAGGSEHRWPTLLSLGLPLVWTGLHRVMEWRSGRIDAEVLRLVRERIEAAESRTTDDGESGVTFEEWDMSIDILERAKWHIDHWQNTQRRPWVMDEVVQHKDEDKSDEEDNLDERSRFIRRPDVLTTFSLLVQKVVGAWTQPNWTGPSERLFALMISLAPNLSDAHAQLVLDQCEVNELCLPSHPDWLQRTEEVVKVFYLVPAKPSGSRGSKRGASAATRRRALQLLTSLHGHLRHLDSVRNHLVGSIVMPLLETSFEAETDVDVAEVLLSLAGEIARDALTEEEKLHQEGNPEEKEAQGSIDTFERLRLLLSRVAKQPTRAYDRTTSAPATPKAQQKSRVGLGSLSRYSSLRQSPSPSTALSAAATEAEPTDVSYLAVLGLIGLFHQCLARSTPCSAEKAIVIFRDLLSLLAPTMFSSADFTAEPTIALRTRLVILQWMVRLRADAAHRVHWIHDVDISTQAKTLGRIHRPPVPTMDESVHEEDDVRSRGRAPRGGPIVSEPGRSRSTSRLRRASGERSPSRGPTMRRATPAQATSYQAQLWTVPESLPFEFGVEAVSVGGRGLASFDHNQMRNWTEEEDPGTGLMMVKQAEPLSASSVVVLPVSEYLAAVIYILRHDQVWELVSYLLCHLPEQLSNKHFACGPRCAQQIHVLREALCTSLRASERSQVVFPLQLPPGVRRAEIHAAAYGCLTALIAYRSLFTKKHQDEMVGTFVHGLGEAHHTAKPCIHALSIAAFEMRPSMTKHLSESFRQLAKAISTDTLAVHILEYIAGVGQQPGLYSNFTEQDYYTVFIIGTKYIQTHNDELAEAAQGGEDELDDDSSEEDDAEKRKQDKLIKHAFSQYVYLLAYYAIETWFLALKLPERHKAVDFLTGRLIHANESKAEVDEPTEVCFDMIARYAYTNADPRAKLSDFDQVIVENPTGMQLVSKTWIVGTATITIQSTPAPAWVQVIIRRPSGVAKMLWELQNIAGVSGATEVDLVQMYLRHRERNEVGLRGHLESAKEALAEATGGEASTSVGDTQSAQVTELTQLAESTRPIAPKLDSGLLAVDPSFFALQLSAFPEMSKQSRPLLVTDAAMLRMIAGLDQIAVVDSHKIGVLYAGPGQKDEVSILSNTHGSKSYIELVSRLGNLIRLKGSRAAGLYAGGLDQNNDEDGKWTYIWDDDISELIFHVATLMPARENNINFKKRHIGNDYVKIIYNDSGADFRFDTLPGDFNFVNIVVEPHTPAGNPWIGPGMTNNTEFFKVSMQCKAGMPEIGPLGSGKMVTAESLPEVVRQLSLHSNIFAQVYLATVGFQDTRGNQQFVEYNSNWRRRLQQIKKVKQRLLQEKGIRQDLPRQTQFVDMDAAEDARKFTDWLSS